MTPAPSALAAAAEALTAHAADAELAGPGPLRWAVVAVAAGARRRPAPPPGRRPTARPGARRRPAPVSPPPARIAKTLALFGSAGLRIGSITGDARPTALALDALDTLDRDVSAGPRAWGYPFDVQTRWSYYPAGAPNVVVTAFATAALLDGARATGRDAFAERARAAARWALEELWVEPGGFFAYHNDSRVNVHNANLLGAAAVDAALGDDTGARDRVARAVDRSLSHQAADGSWPYGEGGPRLGRLVPYRLRAAVPVTAAGDRSAVDDAIARGARHYERFFDAAGRAKLWADRRWPEDGHSAGTGLSALAALLDNGHVERALLERVAQRTLTAGVRGPTAVARRHRIGHTTVWYPRWCDGHVALGLADAATVLARPG